MEAVNGAGRLRERSALEDEGGLSLEVDGWTASVRRSGEWAVGYVQCLRRWSWAWLLADPWDAWCVLDPWHKRNSLMSFLRKQVQQAEAGQSTEPVDKDFQLTFPALSEYLTSHCYPDGSARERSTVSVFFEEGQFKACLNERDQGLVLFVSESKFGCLFEALELLLQAEHVPCRISKQKAQASPGSKHKRT